MDSENEMNYKCLENKETFVKSILALMGGKGRSSCKCMYGINFFAGSLQNRNRLE